jgi:hypothetical protein
MSALQVSAPDCGPRSRLRLARRQDYCREQRGGLVRRPGDDRNQPGPGSCKDAARDDLPSRRLPCPGNEVDGAPGQVPRGTGLGHPVGQRVGELRSSSAWDVWRRGFTAPPARRTVIPWRGEIHSPPAQETGGPDPGRRFTYLGVGGFWCPLEGGAPVWGPGAAGFWRSCCFSAALTAFFTSS